MLEHVEPEIIVRGAENLELPEDFAREFHRREPAGGDNSPIIDRRRVFVECSSGLPWRVFGEVTRHVAGVSPIVEEARARQGKRTAANSCDRHV